MLVPGNVTASIIFSVYFAVALVAIPIWVGLVCRTPQRATSLSAACGLLGAVLIVGLAVVLRGLPGLPPAQTAVALLGGSVTIATIAGWLTHRVTGIYRASTPIAATRKVVLLFLRLTVKVALLFVVLSAVWVVGTVNLADEIPQLMFQLLQPVHYLNVAAALIVVPIWVFMYARRNKSAAGLPVVQVIPATITILLLLPALLALLQTAWSTPLLDCSPKGIAGYVPDMIDYTRFVLDALGRGVLIDSNANIGRPSAVCAPLATSHVARGLAFALSVTPVAMLALLFYRYYRLHRRWRVSVEQRDAA